MQQQLPTIDPTNQCTSKQWKFARAYVENGGNGSQAARDAGYSGSDTAMRVRGAENVARRNVQDAIDRITQWNADAAQVTPEYVIQRLLMVVDQATASGELAHVTRALELLGRTLGIFDKSSTIQADQFQITIQRVDPTIIDGRATLVDAEG